MNYSRENIPLVSIVIPTFNRGRKIKRAIKSCQNQTYRNIEIIVCDDHSTDETCTIVESIKDNDSRVILCHTEAGHKGANAARNAGIKIAKGDYFCFLDSDDELTKDSIAVRVKIFEKDKDIGMVYGNAIFMQANRSYPVKYDDVPNEVDEAKKYLLMELSLCIQSSMMIRLTPYRAIGWLDEEQKGWTDDGVAVAVGTKYKVINCHEYVCIIHKSKISMTSNKENLAQGLEFLVNKYKKEIINTISYKRYCIWKLRIIYSKLYSYEQKCDVCLLKMVIYGIRVNIRKYLVKYYNHWFE